LPLIYKEVKLEVGYRIDLLVESCIIIELKSVESLNEIHLAQILTYMKLSKIKLGLLVNFNVKHLKDGIKRVIL
jgi:GxxExxY protein